MIKSKIYRLYLIFKEKVICCIYKSPIVMGNEETINKILNDRCSISRFGDGEFFLLTGKKGFDFQKRNAELSKRLLEVLKSNESGLLIGIPKVFQNSDLKMRTAESKKWWKNYLIDNRELWYKYLDKDKIYYNTNFTRNYIALKDKSRCDKYFNNVRQIWNDREVIIVEGEFSRLGVKNNLFDNAKSINRILAPNENAFDKYDLILKEILKQNKEKLILIALGPTATVLAYDLYKNGYQAVDIGHLDIEYEWFLQRATTRVPIKDKYTFEANNLIKVDNFNNNVYKKQIIAKIL